MQKTLTIKELENVVKEIDEIQEPIIVKRENKKDLVLLSLEEYRKKIALTEFLTKLEKSEKQYEDGKVHDARMIFRELREKYGY